MGGREARAKALISFRAAAVSEFAAAIDYYDREREGRGQRFAGEVERTLDVIALLPLAYPLLQAPDVRSAKVRYFPYRVVYVYVRGNVDVLAVAHAKRRADYWHRRVP
jgi:toxin ParE1/3/4